MDKGMNPEAFQSAVLLGLTTGDWEPFFHWEVDNSIPCFKNGAEAHNPPFDDAVMDRLIEIISDARFVNDVELWRVLWLIELNWGVITETQRSKILPAFISLFFASAEYNVRAQVLELLGESFTNEAAMNALEQFAQVEDAGKREGVPMGFYDVIRITDDLPLARRAYKNLRRMAQDADKNVRDNAKAYIEDAEWHADRLKFPYADLIAE